MTADAQRSAYEAFMWLHRQPGAFVMPNAWDGGSAALLRQAGFRALGSSSYALATGLGRPDARRAVSRAESIDHAALLARASNLPVNGDLEDGYGDTPEACVQTVQAAIAAGLAGLGLEDTTGNAACMIRDFDAAVARIRVAAQAARDRIVLTGRTDLLLHGGHDIDEVVRRLVAFAEAGADVLYAPGLPDLDAIARVVRAVAPKPVNVLIGPGASLSALAEIGVRRVSLGGALYRRAMAGVRQAAEQLLAGDLAAAVRDALPSTALAAEHTVDSAAAGGNPGPL